MKKHLKVLSVCVLSTALMVSGVTAFATDGPEGERPAPLSIDFFQEYVDSGVLSDDEYDDIEAYLDEKAADREDSMSDVTNMTEEERLEFKDSHYETFVPLEEALVDEGIISSSQSSEIEWKKVPEKAKATDGTKRYDGLSPDDISVTVNGVLVTSDVKAFVDGNNRTLIELRSVAEALDADISWNGDTKTVTLVLDDEIVEIEIGKAKYRRNGSEETMDTAAVIKDGRTMVPVRIVAEALGADVKWDADTKTVQITL